MRLFLLVSVLLLASCATREEQIAEKCRGYGFSPGSEPWQNCVMQWELADEADRKAIGRGLLFTGPLMAR